MTTRQERLEDIQKNPGAHKHTFEGLQQCCFIDGAIDLSLMEAHPKLGSNGGRKCDVTSGPCSCGAFHR